MARNHTHRIPCVLHSSRLITLLAADFFFLLIFAWLAHISWQIVYVAVLCQIKAADCKKYQNKQWRKIVDETSFRTMAANFTSRRELFSILKYNFRSIHFFVNQIDMFVSKIWVSSCRWARAESAISGHVNFLTTIRYCCIFKTFLLWNLSKSPTHWAQTTQKAVT